MITDDGGKWCFMVRKNPSMCGSVFKPMPNFKIRKILVWLKTYYISTEKWDFDTIFYGNKSKLVKKQKILFLLP